MNGRASQIGFSQRIRLEWLEQTANLVLAGNDKATVNDSLQGLLKEKDVMLSPGTYFGKEGYLRINTGSNNETLTEGLRRLGEYFEGRETQ